MSIIASGRAAVSSHILIDTCVIQRITTSFNDTTGEMTDSTSQLYSGGCRVKPLRGAELDVGEADVAMHMYQVTVPWDTDGVDPDDVVTVTSTDGDLDGAKLIVEDVVGSSFSISRKLICRLDIE